MASIHSSGEKRTARCLLSSTLASVVLPEPGNPHTMINLGPLSDLSIAEVPSNNCDQIDFNRSATRELRHSHRRSRGLVITKILPIDRVQRLKIAEVGEIDGGAGD